VNVDDDDDDNNAPASGLHGSDDKDGLIMYPEGLHFSSFGDTRGESTSGYCGRFNSGDY